MRKAAFVFGCPPDTPERVCDAVRDTPGLDQDRFARDLHRRQAREVYASDWEETRRSNDHVRQLQGDWPGMGSLNQIDGRDRYAFRTLLSRGPGGEFAVPNWRDLEDCIKALEPCPVPWPRFGRTFRPLAAIRRVRTEKPLRPRRPAAPGRQNLQLGKGFSALAPAILLVNLRHGRVLLTHQGSYGSSDSNSASVYLPLAWRGGFLPLPQAGPALRPWCFGKHFPCFQHTVNLRRWFAGKVGDHQMGRGFSLVSV